MLFFIVPKGIPANLAKDTIRKVRLPQVATHKAKGECTGATAKEGKAGVSSKNRRIQTCARNVFRLKGTRELRSLTD